MFYFSLFYFLRECYYSCTVYFGCILYCICSVIIARCWSVFLPLSSEKWTQVCLHSLLTNTVVQAYNTGRPVWSCCWCQDNNNYIYAGLSSGSVLVYDTRDTSTHVQELAPLRSRSGNCSCVSGWGSVRKEKFRFLLSIHLSAFQYDFTQFKRETELYACVTVSGNS